MSPETIPYRFLEPAKKALSSIKDIKGQARYLYFIS
jgi:hypothetical protein